ncbi:MAG: UbiA family prenyltransferase [Clostridiaceae bacterium]|nr:UbiA family prenyltransferase [Eubacteriales bacterium]
MSAVKRLFSYVEIKTKVTSVFPFLMTLAYLFAHGAAIDLPRTAVFFFGMLLFDLTATSINNYEDSKKTGQPIAFSRKTALRVTLFLFFLSAALGLWLVALTDAVVLLAGGLCFLFGVMYSYGPVPISHGPYGELASGFFYGFLIPFLLVYVNVPQTLLTYAFSNGTLAVEFGLMPLIGLILLAVLPFCLTANIMLANNICDCERDIAAKRFTLAYYLGKKRSLRLFAALYYLAYASAAAMAIFGLLPPTSLLLLLTLVPVQKNINAFFKKQEKGETFILSVKNFLIVILTHIALIALGGLLPAWGPR